MTAYPISPKMSVNTQATYSSRAFANNISSAMPNTATVPPRSRVPFAFPRPIRGTGRTVRTIIEWIFWTATGHKTALVHVDLFVNALPEVPKAVELIQNTPELAHLFDVHAPGFRDRLNVLPQGSTQHTGFRSLAIAFASAGVASSVITSSSDPIDSLKSNRDASTVLIPARTLDPELASILVHCVTRLSTKNLLLGTLPSLDVVKFEDRLWFVDHFLFEQALAGADLLLHSLSTHDQVIHSLPPPCDTLVIKP